MARSVSGAFASMVGGAGEGLDSRYESVFGSLGSLGLVVTRFSSARGVSRGPSGAIMQTITTYQYLFLIARASSARAHSGFFVLLCYPIWSVASRLLPMTIICSRWVCFR